MDTAAQWPQGITVKPMEEIATCPKPGSLERKVRPHKVQALNCPRCSSTNTKFCYYNNYSLSQPRYFCKTCRRYWTEGGSLRNIPIGGGSRKNKRPFSSSSSSSSSASSSSSSYSKSSTKKLPDSVPLQQQNPKNSNILGTGQDLNLGFSIHHRHHHQHADIKAITEIIQVPSFEDNSSPLRRGISIRDSQSLELHNPNSSLEMLTASSGLNNYAFMPFPVVTGAAADFGSEFPNLPEFKLSSLSFSLDHGLGSNYGSFQGAHETNGNSKQLLFPFEDLSQDHSSNTNNHGDQQNRDTSAAGYWNGVIGGGSW